MSFRPGLGRVALVVSLLLGAAAEVEGQGVTKGAGGGFRLFARFEAILEVNRVTCPVSQTGELCYNDFHGTYSEWPKGSAQFYMYNSGLQLAGTVESGIEGFGWSGDTTGAFFYDPKGTTQHGLQVEPIWDHSNVEDRAGWPEMARVGLTDTLYAPALRGRASASEGDLWWLMWDGNPALAAGRSHPLGVVLETRALAWNQPAWNQDIIYFVHTFHNISSSCAADYAGVRPGLRERLISLGVQFQELNEARFGIDLPDCGYDIVDAYVANSADFDVSSDAGENYGSVNLPMALGFGYHDRFKSPDHAYVLPSQLREAPFLDGYGFFGLKFLGGPAVDPDGPGGAPASSPQLRMYSNTVNGGLFNDPRDVRALYRYLTGGMSAALGDGICNTGTPSVTRICYVKQDGPADVRSFQSAGPAVIPPGGSTTLVTAYVLGGAVVTAGCPTPNCPSVLPGDPLRLLDAAGLASTGANLVDSIAGFAGYQDDNGDGVVQTGEFRTVRGSLLFKAQLAQAIFDRKFLLPSAPAAPDFFLVPGDDQVAILWRPSATELSGDSFFEPALDPSSPAYDPNYRQFDVEGYRIYRGRVDDPSRLTLVAQYDYADRDSQGRLPVMRDYLGAVKPPAYCAPELGRNTIAEGCPVDFDDPPPSGTPYTSFVEHRITGAFVQVRLGDRFLSASGTPYIVTADTVWSPTQWEGVSYLEDTGVPFVHLDTEVRNNLRYFYTVTAFDVNSIQSGPSSLESPKVVKSVTPVAPASNYVNDTTIVSGVFGRGVQVPSGYGSAPSINSSTGVFSGPARAATGAQIGLPGPFIAQLVTESGELSITLDSMTPGSAYDTLPATYWYSVTSGAGTVPLPVQIIQDQFNAPGTADGTIAGPAVSAERMARYGGSGEYRLTAQWYMAFPGNYYTAAFGRGCVNGAPGFRAAACDYNGARWFDDSTEVFPHPTQGNNNNFANELVTNRTNAGSLAGVANVYEARAYQTRPNFYRTVEGVLGTIATAADYRVWWGPNGTIDSVVDITHNVTLPFRADLSRGYTWGFLTQGSQMTSGPGITDERNTAISVSDFGCVAPIRTYTAPATHLSCVGGPTYLLENNIGAPGDFAPLAFGHTLATDRTITPTTNRGFGMYIAGHFFLFEMNSNNPAAPPAGSLWTLRTYVGSVNGGTGGPNATGGSFGAYSFTPQQSPFTAVGASLKVQYTVSNAIRSTTRNDLSQVHTIPDPYYRTNSYETSDDQKVIKFVNLPDQAIIRIYTLSGILVRVIEHNSSTFGGQADWDVRNQGGRLVASGVYFYHLESPSGARRVGRMTVVTDGR